MPLEYLSDEEIEENLNKYSDSKEIKKIAQSLLEADKRLREEKERENLEKLKESEFVYPSPSGKCPKGYVKITIGKKTFYVKEKTYKEEIEPKSEDSKNVDKLIRYWLMSRKSKAGQLKEKEERKE